MSPLFNKWRRYSYTAQKTQVHRRRWVLLWILSFFLIYFILTSSCFFTLRLDNETMQPALISGDRFICVSHAIFRLLPDSPEIRGLRRGNIALIDTGLLTRRNILIETADLLLRFFTAQQVSLYSRNDSRFIKRIVGLPGDEITMSNYVIRVRPEGSDYDLTEYERAEKFYDVTIPQVPALWDESLPFSGAMESITLGEDECFVLSDDRNNTNDSRVWGPVKLDLVAGKVLFRYWPLTRLGRP